jgi:hypothetical protein
MEYIRAMPGVTFSADFCLPRGTVVPNRFERRETTIGAATRHATAASQHSEMTRGADPMNVVLTVQASLAVKLTAKFELAVALAAKSAVMSLARERTERDGLIRLRDCQRAARRAAVVVVGQRRD